VREGEDEVRRDCPRTGKGMAACVRRGGGKAERGRAQERLAFVHYDMDTGKHRCTDILEVRQDLLVGL
jgi:hypothetical protein